MDFLFFSVFSLISSSIRLDFPVLARPIQIRSMAIPPHRFFQYSRYRRNAQRMLEKFGGADKGTLEKRWLSVYNIIGFAKN